MVSPKTKPNSSTGSTTANWTNTEPAKEANMKAKGLAWKWWPFGRSRRKSLSASDLPTAAITAIPGGDVPAVLPIPPIPAHLSVSGTPSVPSPPEPVVRKGKQRSQSFSGTSRTALVGVAGTPPPVPPVPSAFREHVATPTPAVQQVNRMPQLPKDEITGEGLTTTQIRHRRFSTAGSGGLYKPLHAHRDAFLSVPPQYRPDELGAAKARGAEEGAYDLNEHDARSISMARSRSQPRVHMEDWEGWQRWKPYHYTLRHNTPDFGANGVSAVQFNPPPRDPSTPPCTPAVMRSRRATMSEMPAEATEISTRAKGKAKVNDDGTDGANYSFLDSEYIIDTSAMTLPSTTTTSPPRPRAKVRSRSHTLGAQEQTSVLRPAAAEPANGTTEAITVKKNFSRPRPPTPAPQETVQARSDRRESQKDHHLAPTPDTTAPEGKTIQPVPKIPVQAFFFPWQATPTEDGVFDFQPRAPPAQAVPVARPPTPPATPKEEEREYAFAAPPPTMPQPALPKPTLSEPVRQYRLDTPISCFAEQAVWEEEANRIRAGDTKKASPLSSPVVETHPAHYVDDVREMEADHGGEKSVESRGASSEYSQDEFWVEEEQEGDWDEGRGEEDKDMREVSSRALLWLERRR